jgi:hypothetical protein
MSLFYRVENFPYTIERENGDITPATNKDKSIIPLVYLKLEKIFNDNAQVRL